MLERRLDGELLGDVVEPPGGLLCARHVGSGRSGLWLLLSSSSVYVRERRVRFAQEY
jgi:hypothetical protein